MKLTLVPGDERRVRPGAGSAAVAVGWSRRRVRTVGAAVRLRVRQAFIGRSSAREHAAALTERTAMVSLLLDDRTVPNAAPDRAYRTDAPRDAREVSLDRAVRGLATAPDVPALFARACLLDLLDRPDEACAAYLEVLARDFTHRDALAHLGTLLVRANRLAAALTVFRRATVSAPDDPAAWTREADLLRRLGRHEEAEAAYRAALAFDDGFAPAHRGVASLIDDTDPDGAERHRARGADPQPLSTAPFRGAGAPVRVLRLVSARGGNVPTGCFLDDRVFLVHTLCVDGRGDAVLPPHDVVVNAIGDADRAGASLDAAARVLSRTTRPVLNRPDAVGATGRLDIGRRFRAVGGVVAPRIALASHADLEAGRLPPGFRFPILLRRPGFHGGRHLHRVRDRASLARALAAMPGTASALLVIAYHDTAGVDGLHRKYRAMLIGGAVLPLHLAIGDDWKVHHATAGMERDRARRDEERRFLEAPDQVVGPEAWRTLAGIAGTIGLDYAGIDFALDRDGRVLVFEANATMTLARPGDEPIWDYRRPAIERARKAACALVRRMAAAPSR